MICAPDIKVLSGSGHILSVGTVRLCEIPDYCPTGTAHKGGDTFKSHRLKPFPAYQGGNRAMSGAYNRDGVVTGESNGVLLRPGRSDFPTLLHEPQRELSGAQVVRKLQGLESGLWPTPKTTQQHYIIERENRSGNEHSNQ